MAVVEREAGRCGEGGRALWRGAGEGVANGGVGVVEDEWIARAVEGRRRVKVGGRGGE
jgi:hypothetical protein